MASFDRKKGPKGRWKARTKVGTRFVFLGYHDSYWDALGAEYRYLEDNCPNPTECLHDFCYRKRSENKTFEQMMEGMGLNA